MNWRWYENPGDCPDCGKALLPHDEVCRQLFIAAHPASDPEVAATFAAGWECLACARRALGRRWRGTAARGMAGVGR